jgi:ribonucleoside-triphosphate reductase (formate)
MTKKISVIKKTIKADATDKSLSVQNFSEFESINPWNKQTIIDALKTEARMDIKLAEEIADNVEKKIIKLDIDRITTDFIRSLVDEELVMKGLNKKLLKQKMLGVSTFDLEQVIFSKTKENANVQANTPEAINMYLSEAILKQYALNRVFSQNVADAHLTGKIHCYSEDLKVTIKENDIIKQITIKELYDKLS